MQPGSNRQGTKAQFSKAELETLSHSVPTLSPFSTQPHCTGVCVSKAIWHSCSASYRLRAVFPKVYHQNHWVFAENSLVLRTEPVFQGRGSKEPDFCFKASQVIVMALECGKHMAWELESKGVYSSGCPLTFPVFFPASFSPSCQADFPRDCKSRQQAMEGSHFWCGQRKWTTTVCMTEKGGGRVCSGLGSLRVHVFTLSWIWGPWSGLWNEPKSSHSHSLKLWFF